MLRALYAAARTFGKDASSQALLQLPQGKRSTHVRSNFLTANAANALAQIACKPRLSFKTISEIASPGSHIARKTWKASVFADTTFCATRSGSFEIDFVRIKENSTDLQFTERFRWAAGRFDVQFEMTADESILELRIGFIAPCVCREFPDHEADQDQSTSGDLVLETEAATSQPSFRR
jgi:hypothetical protein